MHTLSIQSLTGILSDQVNLVLLIVNLDDDIVRLVKSWWFEFQGSWLRLWSLGNSVRTKSKRAVLGIPL